MRRALRMKREANPPKMDPVLTTTGDRPIVEVSAPARDAWWGSRPTGARYQGNNVLERLWTELRQHVRDGDPASRPGAWTGRIQVGCLTGTGVAGAARTSGR